MSLCSVLTVNDTVKIRKPVFKVADIVETANSCYRHMADNIHDMFNYL